MLIAVLCMAALAINFLKVALYGAALAIAAAVGDAVLLLALSVPVSLVMLLLLSF